MKIYINQFSIQLQAIQSAIRCNNDFVQFIIIISALLSLF